MIVCLHVCVCVLVYVLVYVCLLRYVNYLLCTNTTHDYNCSKSSAKIIECLYTD